MKFTLRLMPFMSFRRRKTPGRLVFGQGDEFTCVDHFPSPLAML
ncbi:polymerase [Enterobacter sp. RIT418]|nr:polymerase [Enterobacter sp. RIT 418]